jgi:mannose-6-phosphate isomerase-like protein (cupin superfamily)
MRKPFKKHLTDINIEEAHGGNGKRQLILSPSDPVSTHLEAMTKGFLEANRTFDWHCHENIDEFFLVLKGVGKIEFENGTSVEYQPDDLVYIPSNTRHRIKNTGSDTNEFFFIRLSH